MIAFKRTKYLGINLTKDVEDFYTEINKTVQKEILKDQANGKILCSWITRHCCLDGTTVIYVFNSIPIKI